MKARKLRYSRQAAADLASIAEYSLDQWGEAQAAGYLAQLEECCLRAARQPHTGRSCSLILPGLRRMEQGSHVVFFLPDSTGILIVRILHGRMQPERWIRGEEE